MTGAQHYQAAERLIALPGTHNETYLLLAHIHATLALAAATALGAPGQPARDYEAWQAYAATPASTREEA